MPDKRKGRRLHLPDFERNQELWCSPSRGEGGEHGSPRVPQK